MHLKKYVDVQHRQIKLKKTSLKQGIPHREKNCILNCADLT